jgi:hypothetical protein
VRRILARSALVLAIAAPAHAENKESWGFVVASRQEVLLSYGVPESDSVTINFFCRPTDRQIEIVSAILPAKPRKSQPLTTTLTNGTARAAYAGKVHHHQEHGYHFAATTPLDRKVVDVLKSGTTLTIGIPGKQHRVPLRGVPKPLAQFETACFGKR